MTFSFLQAFKAKENGKISWDEYIHHLLARCGGVKHEADNQTGSFDELSNTDPFGHSIWLWSDKVGLVKGMRGIIQMVMRLTIALDTAPLEAVFLAYRHGTLEEVKTKASLLEGSTAEGVNDSLALLALQERRADVLRFCLDARGTRRFPFQALFVFRNLADSVDVEKDPETFQALEQSQFWKQYPRRPHYVRKRAERAGAPSSVAKSLDIGGEFPVNW